MCADQLTRRDFVKVAALGIGGTSTSRQDINARTASFRQSEPQSAQESPSTPNGHGAIRQELGRSCILITPALLSCLAPCSMPFKPT
jgi:hypothetical protein